MTIPVIQEPSTQMQNTDRWQVGNATVTRVIESEAGAFPPGFMFTDLTEERVQSINWLHPHYETTDGNITFSLHTYVIESDGKRILVTTPGNVRTRSHSAARSRSWSPATRTRSPGCGPVAEVVAEMNAQAFGLTAQGGAEWISDDIADIIGRDPRSFEQFARDHANAFTPAATTGA